MTRGPVNSVQVNPVNYTQFTGSVSPPCPAEKLGQFGGIEKQQPECLYTRHLYRPTQLHRLANIYTRHVQLNSDQFNYK